MGKKPKHRRRLFIILAIIGFILLAGLFSLNKILDNLVKKEVNSQLNKSPNSLYVIHFEDIRINIFTGSIKVINLTVTPSDSATILLHEGKIKKLLTSRVPVFKIKGLKILDFIKDHYIHIDEIDLTGFQVDYLINAGVKEPENKNTLVMHNVFSDNFKGATIGSINVNADAFRFYHVDQKDSSIFEIDSVHILITEIAIDSGTLKKPIPADFKDIRINTGHFSLNSMKYYTISTTDIQFDIIESSLTIEGFRLNPKFSKTEFNTKIRYNTDWFSIKTEKIKFNGLIINGLEFNHLLSFSSIQIENPDINIYRDKRLPDAPYKYKPLLAGIVNKIPLDLNIDTLMITGGKLQYEEQTSASDQPGTVFFDPMNLTALHITNTSDLIAENPSMRIEFNGKIMAAANLNARIDIDLSSKNEEFRISGTLEPVSGTSFNPMVENQLPVSIVSADISKTEFTFTASDDISHGQLIMQYDNLGVEVIKGKEHDKKAGLISVVANGLLNSKNTPEHNKYREGTVRFERRKDKGIVNFLWNSCKSGIISIVAPIADHTKKDEKKEIKEEKKEEREKSKNKQKG